MDIKLRDIDKLELRRVLNNIGVRSLNRLLEEIGLGLRVGNIVAQQFMGFLKENKKITSKNIVPLEITGSEGLIHPSGRIFAHSRVICLWKLDRNRDRVGVLKRVFAPRYE